MGTKTRKVAGRTIMVRQQKPPAGSKTCPECKERFIPKRSDQIYCKKACQNRVGQRRLRERARIGA